MSAPKDGPGMLDHIRALEDKLREEFDQKLDDLRKRIQEVEDSSKEGDEDL